MQDMPRIPRRSREEAVAFPEDVSETYLLRVSKTFPNTATQSTYVSVRTV